METRKKKALQELRWINTYLDGTVVYENGTQVLKVAEQLGEGEVRCICFDLGLIAMEFDVLLKKDIQILLDDGESKMIYFLYCLQGNCFHRFHEETRVSKLEELQTGVVSNKLKVASELLVHKEERLVLNVIRLDKNRYIQKFKDDEEGFDNNIVDIIESIDIENGFHLGRLNLEIGELIKLLENAKYVNDLSTLMQFEGICHLILGKQVEQFNSELGHGNLVPSGLSKRLMLKITEIGDFVKNYPEVQHSVDSLCRKSGIAAAKLQKGFKFAYQKTVGEYVRDCRLVRAEYLLRTTEMNVSEVVYSIGFTSRSYFCKIFKAKYHCSPKAYKNKMFVSGLPSSITGNI